jgi:hypothetical protein
MTIKNKDMSLLDLADISDLPDDIKNSLAKRAGDTISDKILSLFEIKNPLSIDEIIVGLYRGYKMKKPRHAIQTYMVHLRTNNEIKRLPGRIAIYDRIKK